MTLRKSIPFGLTILIIILLNYSASDATQTQKLIPSRADALECPFGTLAYGMTISAPGSTYWRDPKKGPPDEDDTPIPFSVCLFCFRITETDLIESKEVEVVSLNNRNSPSYQICIGKGDLRRTILQTFDCRESSYLKSFYKSLGDSNSTYGCAEPEVAADDSGNKSSQSYSYDSKFPDTSGITSIRARTNWQDFETDLSCEEDNEFFCGLDIHMDGRYPKQKKDKIKDKKDSNEVEEFNDDNDKDDSKISFDRMVKANQRGPQMKVKCCSINEVAKASKMSYVSAFSLKEMCGRGYPTAIVVVLAILAAVFAFGFLACTINYCCCPVFPESLFTRQTTPKYIGKGNKVDPDLEEIDESGEVRSSSSFNTRPSTANGS